MRPGSHMLQMIPYGWLIHPHWNPASTWLIRGKSFKQVARAVGASYRQGILRPLTLNPKP